MSALVSASLRLNHKMKNKYYRLSILIILTILAGLFLYQTAIIKVISAVIHREGSSHGIFVPFLSLYFIWLKRDIIRDIEPQFDYLGIILIVLGTIGPLFNIGNFQINFLFLIVFLAYLISATFRLISSSLSFFLPDYFLRFLAGLFSKRSRFPSSF